LSDTKSHSPVDSTAGSYSRDNGFKDAMLTENLRVSSQPLYSNDTISQIGHDYFLPRHFQYMIPYTLKHSILYSRNRKQRRRNK